MDPVPAESVAVVTACVPVADEPPMPPTPPTPCVRVVVRMLPVAVEAVELERAVELFWRTKLAQVMRVLLEEWITIALLPKK